MMMSIASSGKSGAAADGGPSVATESGGTVASRFVVEVLDDRFIDSSSSFLFSPAG